MIQNLTLGRAMQVRRLQLLHFACGMLVYQRKTM